MDGPQSLSNKRKGDHHIMLVNSSFCFQAIISSKAAQKLLVMWEVTVNTAPVNQWHFYLNRLIIFGQLIVYSVF